MANTWNQSGTTWNTGRWGTTEAFAVGWGARAWNDGEWGELKDETVSLTGQSITSSVGSVVAFPEQGWGRDTWNFESWGFSGLTVELDGQSITSNLGANGWSNASYGDNGWGMFTVNPADVMGLTGQEITSAVPSQLDIPEQIQGLSITSSVGSITPDQITVGLSGQSGTLSVGTTAFDLTSVITPTGQQITSNTGDLITGTIEFIPVTGVSATLSSGSISLDQMTVGLSGQSGTSSVGSIAPADVMGLTGQAVTSSVAAFGTATGFGIQAYQSVDTGSNSSYTDVATGSNTSYTDAA